MSSSPGPGRPPVDELLDRLESAIGRLADGRAPLEELVRSHEEATRLLGEAEASLAALAERAGRIGEGHPGGRHSPPGER